MSVPPIASPLSQLGRSPFSFYPPIVGVEHNEWIFRRATWNEIEVINTKTAEELAIPRHFVGEVSLVGEPVLIVGLIKEIEYREGAVYPYVRRVIEMPRAVNDWRRRPAPQPGPAPVVGIRVESGRRTRNWFGTIVAGLLACMAFVTVFRESAVTSRLLTRSAAGHIELPFTARDNYDSIVRKLGPPARDEIERGYRRLYYPQRSFTLLLTLGSDSHYAGAVDANGRAIHSARTAR